MHNAIEEVDELEETLSLCDLPLYSDQSADWDQDLSLASNSQEDYFEFFSQQLHPPESIIFCGKIIPFKQPTIQIQTINKRKHHWQFFKWKVSKREEELSRNGTTKLGKGHGKMSASSSGKGNYKWYFLMFGISKFSPVVELRDIKSRQRSLRHHDGGVVNSDRGWGLWGLIIRILSCGRNHHSTTVTVVSVDGHASPEQGRHPHPPLGNNINEFKFSSEME